MNPSYHYLRLLFILLFIVVSGCRVGPNYEAPSVCSPQEWKASPRKIAESPQVENWWDVFDDEVLCRLEIQALENNPSLKQALARVVEARSLVEVSRAALYPQVTLNPSYSDTGQLFKLYLPQGVASLPLANPNLSVYRIHQYQYVLPLNLSYEIDLWGRLRSQYEATVYDAQAQEEDYLNIMLTLTTDIASNYYQLRLLDSQIDILRKTVEERNTNFLLNNSRYVKGVSNALDVAIASLEVSNTESSYYDALRQRALVENVIATLLGLSPADFCLEANPLQREPPVIPAGLPSDVLLRRPDIAEAERKCASQNAEVGVAYASFFPSLSLTGALGYSSPDLSQFLKWLSRLWSLGINGTQTVFDGGRKEADTINAWARFIEASYGYQQQVLTAFQDVENALNNLELQSKQYDSLASSTESAKTRNRLSLQRYQRGVANYLEVTDSENSALTAELSLVNMQGQRYISTVQLIKALGGSWQ